MYEPDIASLKAENVKNCTNFNCSFESIVWQRSLDQSCSMHIMAFLYQGTEAEVCAVIYSEFILSYSFSLLFFPAVSLGEKNVDTIMIPSYGSCQNKQLRYLP